MNAQKEIIRHKVMNGVRGLEIQTIKYVDGETVSFVYGDYDVELTFKITDNRPANSLKPRALHKI